MAVVAAAVDPVDEVAAPPKRDGFVAPPDKKDKKDNTLTPDKE